MNKVRVPDYEASARQTLFHTTEAYEALYGGAAGGGKTAALAAESVTLCLEHPGYTAYLFRKTIPELKSTILKEITRQCAAYINAGGMSYNQLDRQFRFKNGSIIQLAYCESPGDEMKYQSVEYQFLGVDELTHFQREEYEYLKTRVRTSNPSYPLKIRAATNPGGPGHSWVKSYFIDITQPEELYDDKETGLSRVYIPAKVSDNPNDTFVETYTRSLEAIPDPDLKKALLEGNWDVFAGQVFTEFSRNKDNKPFHVVKPFKIPDHWTKWFGFDWGYNTWSAGIWFAKDPQTERIFIYRELYEKEMPASRMAQVILGYDKTEKVIRRMADPAIWKAPASAETGETVAEIFTRNGVRFQPANNNRLAGKNTWHEALATAPDGLPWLQIFSSCNNLIRTLPALPYDKHNVEDVDSDSEDHLYDAGRYGLINAMQVIQKIRLPEFKGTNKFTGY